MEEKKIKKKLTLTISSKKNSIMYPKLYSASSKGKTSVVIEKKFQENGVKKNFNLKDNNFNKTKSTGNFFPKKAQ